MDFSIPVVPAEPEEPTMPDTPIIPTPTVPVTPEQEQAAAQLGADYANGKLLVGDAILARVRTFIPILAGPLLAFLVTRFPALFAFVASVEPGWQELVYGGLSVAFGFGWWSLAKFLGKRWPIAEKIMLGSSKTPVYIDTIKSIGK